MRASNLRSRFSTCFFGLLGLLGSSYASAVVINFDDIERIDDPFWAAHPLSTEYADRGLIIDGGFLGLYDADSEALASSPNYLQGGPYFSLSFVGTLPLFVSMLVTSSHEDAVYLDARLGDGTHLARQVAGWEGPDHDTPPEIKKLITFESTSGIEHIDISAFYFLRNSAMVDDLELRYTVPEPGTLALFLAGLLALTRKRLLKKKLKRML